MTKRIPHPHSRSHRAGSGKACAVIVAHPDDEILWAGGTILSRSDSNWFVATLCRAGDPDLGPKFSRVLDDIGAAGAMANLDDGPDQTPLQDREVQETIVSLLGDCEFDLILTHGPKGEYTRHRRHEEVCQAVVALWAQGRLSANALWMFAYEDGGRADSPRPCADAHRREALAEPVWQQKVRLITEVYGFGPESWEARIVPRVEAFWCFDLPAAAQEWVRRQGRDA